MPKAKRNESNYSFGLNDPSMLSRGNSIFPPPVYPQMMESPAIKKEPENRNSNEKKWMYYL